MFRTAMTRTLLLRGVLAVTAFAIVTPAAVYSTDADAKRSRRGRKAKLKAKAAKAKKEKAKRAAAAKAKKEMQLKRLGKIERLEQIATATKNKELTDIVTRLKEKHQKLNDK